MVSFATTTTRMRCSSLLRKRVHPQSVSVTPPIIKRYLRSIGSTTFDDDNSVTIGDITVDNPPRGSNAPHLIPELPSRLTDFQQVNSSLPPSHVGHLRWMLQKDLVLGQDFLLLGTPNLARER